MKKYEEDRYLFENIKDHIYPWVKESLVDHEVMGSKIISEKDTPLVSFVGDMLIVFVIKRENETFEVLKENMLPPGCDIETLYYKSCENLAHNIDFVISQTMYGGFGIVADGHHEASALCLQHIWNLCAEKLGDDLVIMVPAKDMVLFVPAKDEKKIESMKNFGMESYRRSRDKVSEKLLFFDREKKELKGYE